MRVTVKLVVAFVLGTFVITALGAWWEISTETKEFRVLADQEARRIGQLMEHAITSAWQSGGQAAVAELLRTPTSAESDLLVSWVWFDDRSAPSQPLAKLEQIERVLAQQMPSVIVRTLEAEYVCDYWPIDVPDARHGGLQFLKPTSPLREERHEVIMEAVSFSACNAFLCAILVAVLGIRIVGRPLEKMIQHTQRIANGDLGARLHLESNDELGELANRFNMMCDALQASHEVTQQETAARLRATEQLRHEDRLKTVGRLASGVAHELGTPLNVVAGRAQLIGSGQLPPHEIINSAKTIQHETTRMTTIIRNLLDFARRRTPQRAATDLRSLVDRTVRLLGPLANKHQVEVQVASDHEPCMADVDAGQIEQVFTNIVVNAIQSMPNGGVVTVNVYRRRSANIDGPDGSADQVCVEITDQGVGIPPDDLPHVFEPFFTTKSVGEGTGLGLSISYGIVSDHGGHVDVQSRPGQGSTFTICLPTRSVR